MTVVQLETFPIEFMGFVRATFETGAQGWAGVGLRRRHHLQDFPSSDHAAVTAFCRSAGLPVPQQAANLSLVTMGTKHLPKAVPNAGK
jgi:hypothetical protein